MQHSGSTTAHRFISFLQGNPLWIFLLFLLLSVILFLPTLSKPFLCDDHMVVHRVTVEKIIFINGFFRPLSDITIYACWWLAGLNPFFFNLFNLVVHAGTCLVLYRFCLLVPFFAREKKNFIAWTAALLFLVYPFHSESVLWMVGRASGLAAFFGALSLMAVFASLPAGWKYVLASLFYFIGLAAYETIFPLPAVVLVLLYERGRSWRTYLPWVIAFGITLLAHLGVRYLLSGAIFGTYGEKIFTPSSGYVSNAFKVLGRLLLPPSHHSLVLGFLFAGLVLLLGATAFYFWKKRKEGLLPFAKIVTALGLSCIIPIMFGLSTRTSEGDRLLYFSSFFLAMLLAFVFAYLSGNKRRVFLASSFLYFLVFLVIGNRNWIEAGRITNGILAFVKKEKRSVPSMGLINLPQEYNGALVFRNGFLEALLLEGVDTTGIAVLRTITTEEAREINNDISVSGNSEATFVPPNTFIRADSMILAVQPFSFDTTSFNGKKFSMLYYWNKHRMMRLRSN